MNRCRWLVLVGATLLAGGADAQDSADEEAKKFGRQITPGAERLQDASDAIDNAIEKGKERFRKFMRVETDQERMAREAEADYNRRSSGEEPPKTEAELQKEREEAHQRRVRAAERASDDRREFMRSYLQRFSKAQWDCRNAGQWAHSLEDVRAECKAYADLYKQCFEANVRDKVDCERARRDLNYPKPDELEQQSLDATSKRLPAQPNKAMAVPGNVPPPAVASQPPGYLEAEREARQRESEQVRQQVLSGTAPVVQGNAFRQGDPNAARRAEDAAARRRQEEGSRWRQAHEQQQAQERQAAQQPSASSGNTAQVLNVLGAVAAGAALVEANRRQAAPATGGGMASGGGGSAQPAAQSGTGCGPRRAGEVCTAR